MPRYTQPRNAWRYTNNFKVKAVKLSYQERIQVKQVAESLDIHPFMLSRWRKEYREGKLQGDNHKTVRREEPGHYLNQYTPAAAGYRPCTGIVRCNFDKSPGCAGRLL